MDEQPKISFEPPRGMRDFYPEDMVWRNRVFDAFRAAGEAAGFEPYDACVVESFSRARPARKSASRSTTSATRATATSRCARR